MAFKVNYGLERAERNRAKQAKKDAKLRNRNSGAGDEGTDKPEEEIADADNTKPALPPDSLT